MSFPPTAEQQAVIDAFATGENITVTAVAGSGKTTTTRFVAESTDRRGLYIAFNKSVQLDAQASFPSNVTCKTVHSLAWGAIIPKSPGKKKRLNGSRQTARDVAKILGLNAYQTVEFGGGRSIDINDLVRLGKNAVQKFCQSADTKVSAHHVAREEWATGADHDRLVGEVLPIARAIWAEAVKEYSQMKYEHDYYVKEWSLLPIVRLNYDFIILDEAQDTNPVVIEVLRKQKGTQLVVVGDANQAIYGWRGAVDAMDAFGAKHNVHLTQSFRFGETVADEANKWLDLLDSDVKVVGFDKITSTVAPLQDPTAVLCRTNAGAIQVVMNEIEAGRKPALVGGATEIVRFAQAAENLMRGMKPFHPDLAPFSTWDEVVKYVKEDESGKDLAVMVNLIERYSVAAIVAACNATVSEDEADVIVSTAHKSKGREWDSVQIGSDFQAPKEEGALPSRPEMMLLYVAVTRAKLALDCTVLGWVDSLTAV